MIRSSTICLTTNPTVCSLRRGIIVCASCLPRALAQVFTTCSVVTTNCTFSKNHNQYLDSKEYHYVQYAEYAKFHFSKKRPLLSSGYKVIFFLVTLRESKCSGLLSCWGIRLNHLESKTTS